MSLPIYWSAEAEDTFDDIVTHLELNWSEKEIGKFPKDNQGCSKTDSGVSLDVPSIEIKTGNTKRIRYETMLIVL